MGVEGAFTPELQAVLAIIVGMDECRNGDPVEASF
jgi:hypothetical protein